MPRKCSHPDYYAVCINEWDDTRACVLCLREEIERLHTIIAAYATIEAARRIGRQPPERCLDCVRDYQAERREVVSE